jgi:sarcosine oxidase subunit alpha
MAAAGVNINGGGDRLIAGRLFRISFSGELAYELAVPAHAATRTWLALLEAGRPQGIVPYGLDALNTLRIEKGHVTGAELNGNSSADDLGFGRLLKKKGDFIGRALAARLPAERLQLVALRPVERSRRLRNGAQLQAPGGGPSLGFITSSTPAVAVEGWVGLALLGNGRHWIGQRLLASSPLFAEQTEVEILSPHWLDPENQRVRA